MKASVPLPGKCQEISIEDKQSKLSLLTSKKAEKYKPTTFVGLRHICCHHGKAVSKFAYMLPKYITIRNSKRSSLVEYPFAIGQKLWTNECLRIFNMCFSFA